MKRIAQYSIHVDGTHARYKYPLRLSPPVPRNLANVFYLVVYS